MKTLMGVIAFLLVLMFGATNVAAAEKSKFAGSDSGLSELKDSATTGKVTHVDVNKKTFTIMAKGKQKTFFANNFKTLPKVGEMVDVTYTGTPGGPMQATTVKSSKSNQSE